VRPGAHVARASWGVEDGAVGGLGRGHGLAVDGVARMDVTAGLVDRFEG
jgi:hypothetical protein